MSLETAKKIYKKILTLVEKDKDILNFDLSALKETARCHLDYLELKEVYGLDIGNKSLAGYNYISVDEFRKISYIGEKYNNRISWSVDGRQPNNERLFFVSFPTGPFIFGDGDIFDKDYPVEFFQKFFSELITFKPDYSDIANKTLYWKIENAKEIFNSFNDILKKYYDLNKEDIKQRRIKKMEAELEKLKSQK